MTHDAMHARAFRALSHPRRMRLFRLLAEQPQAGESIHSLIGLSRIPEASFRHHLREMELAGLIKRQRKGPTVRVIVTPQALQAAMETVRLLLRHRSHKATASVRPGPAAFPRTTEHSPRHCRPPAGS